MTSSPEPVPASALDTSISWVSKLQKSYENNVTDRQDQAMVTMSNTRRTGEASMHCLPFHAFLEDDTEQLEFLLARNDSVLLGDITADPDAQLCWTMPLTNECYKFKGRFYIVSAPIHVTRRAPRKAPSSNSKPDEYWEMERLKQWHSLSSEKRAIFTWPPRAERPRHKSKYFSCRKLEHDPIEEGMKIVHGIALDNFCLLLYKPSEIEHLDCTSFPFRRTVYIHEEENNTWKAHSANP